MDLWILWICGDKYDVWLFSRATKRLLISLVKLFAEDLQTTMSKKVPQTCPQRGIYRKLLKKHHLGTLQYDPDEMCCASEEDSPVPTFNLQRTSPEVHTFQVLEEQRLQSAASFLQI